MFDFVHIVSKKNISRIIHNNLHDRYLEGVDYRSKTFFGDYVQTEIFIHSNVNEEDVFHKSDKIKIFIIGNVYTNKNYKAKFSTKQSKIYAQDIWKLYKTERENIINFIKGVFVIFIADEKRKLYFGFTSRSGLYRLYYYNDNDKLIVSTSVSSIIKNLNFVPQRDNIAIIQHNLFEHTLGERTFYRDIKILDNYSYLKYDLKNCEVIEYFSLKDKLKLKSVFSWKDIKSKLPTEFNDVMQLLVPNKAFNSALTGGFDSRTILSYFIKENIKNYQLYSWAADEKWHDVDIAKNISNELNLNYKPIILNEEMLKRYDYQADQLIYWSDGCGSISRTNQMYSHSILAKYSRILFTGYFGSEVFRPLHRSNVMLKENFIDILLSATREKQIKQSYEKLIEEGILKKEFLERYYEEFLEDTLKYFQDNVCFENRGLNVFHYLLKTGFWKFFGQEFHSQRINTSILSPYIDDDFIDFIIKTKIIDVHEGAYKKDVRLLLKSQAIYNPIIKFNSPILMGIETNRGFKPRDFESFIYPVNVLVKYYLRRREERKNKIVGFNSKEWNSDSYNKHSYLFNESDFNKTLNWHKISSKEAAKIYSLNRWIQLFER